MIKENKYAATLKDKRE